MSKISYPFDIAISLSASFDFKDIGDVYSYLLRRGYCNKTPIGIILPCNGWWGEADMSAMDKETRELFLEMVDSKIIELFRIRIRYEGIPYDYEDGVWRTYDKDKKKIVVCSTPKFAIKDNGSGSLF